MSLWLVRGDRYGKYQDLALEKGFVYNMYPGPDLSQIRSLHAAIEDLRKLRPDSKENQLRNWGRQMYMLVNSIKVGDLVAMPLRNSPEIAIGRVAGQYLYRDDLGDIHHTVPVKWLKADIPRTDFGQDLLYSLGAYMTICQVQRNNAEVRVEEIAKGKKDPGPAVVGKKEKGGPGDQVPPVEDGPPDVEQMALDQIMGHIQANFKGHNLSRLVEAVLQAEGYITKLSPPGPDGGVDVFAGRGAFGLDGPRLCAQVKSSQGPVDVNVLRALQGTMQTFKADQGLLVSWGGFTKALEAEAKMSFFSVRLWNANDLINAVLKNYDHFSEELKSELPLKRIWSLVIEE